MDRCLDSRRHVTDPMQGFRHGVGGFTEGDQLAARIRQFGKFKRRLSNSFPEFHERLFGFGGVTDPRGKCHFGLLEVCGCVHGFEPHAHRCRATGQRRTHTRLERHARHRESLAQYRRAAFAQSRKPRAGHLPHAAYRRPDQLRGLRHRSLQCRDVGSKVDSQEAHAPGVASTG